MKSYKFVIGTLLDSMIMNLGKGASASLSEESDSFKLNFSFEREACLLHAFHWSYAPPTTTEFNLRRE